MLVQIEAILNSRSRSLSNDLIDFQTLTPGHFLISSSLTAHPEKVSSPLAENRLSIWQKLSPTSILETLVCGLLEYTTNQE